MNVFYPVKTASLQRGAGLIITSLRAIPARCEVAAPFPTLPIILFHGAGLTASVNTNHFWQLCHRIVLLFWLSQSSH